MDSYSLDASNMTYLYINEDAGKVISNDDELVNNELKYTDNNLSDSSTDAVDYYTMLQNILSKKSNLSYILIQAKPESFTSNLKSLTDYILASGALHHLQFLAKCSANPTVPGKR